MSKTEFESQLNVSSNCAGMFPRRKTEQQALAGTFPRRSGSKDRAYIERFFRELSESHFSLMGVSK